MALLVAPLAGIALLAAAAAVAINPVLVSVSVTNGRRRKRDLNNLVSNSNLLGAEIENTLEEMKVRIV